MCNPEWQKGETDTEQNCQVNGNSEMWMIEWNAKRLSNFEIWNELGSCQNHNRKTIKFKNSIVFRGCLNFFQSNCTLGLDVLQVTWYKIKIKFLLNLIFLFKFVTKNSMWRKKTSATYPAIPFSWRGASGNFLDENLNLFNPPNGRRFPVSRVHPSPST